METFQEGGEAASDSIKIATDDYASVLVHFEGNLRGVFTVSQVSAGRKARLWLEVDGSEGSLAFDTENPNTLWIGRRKQANQEMMKDPSLMDPAARGYSVYPAAIRRGIRTRSPNYLRTSTRISKRATSRRRADSLPSRLGTQKCCCVRRSQRAGKRDGR